MTMQSTRRGILKGGLAVAGLSAFDLPEWALPALAQGETVVPFTDLPANFNPAPAADRRLLDVRKIDGPFTPKRSVLHHAALRPPGRRPRRVPAEGVRPGQQAAGALARRSEEDGEHASSSSGFECSGNRRPLQGLCSNGRWTGVPLQDRARSGRREERTRASSCSSAPTTARRKSSSARRSSRSTSSSAAACSREKALSARAVPRLRAERRAAHQAPGLRRCA